MEHERSRSSSKKYSRAIAALKSTRSGVSYKTELTQLTWNAFASVFFFFQLRSPSRFIRSCGGVLSCVCVCVCMLFGLCLSVVERINDKKIMKRNWLLLQTTDFSTFFLHCDLTMIVDFDLSVWLFSFRLESDDGKCPEIDWNFSVINDN